MDLTALTGKCDPGRIVSIIPFIKIATKLMHHCNGFQTIPKLSTNIRMGLGITSSLCLCTRPGINVHASACSNSRRKEPSHMASVMNKLLCEFGVPAFRWREALVSEWVSFVIHGDRWEEFLR